MGMALAPYREGAFTLCLLGCSVKSHHIYFIYYCWNEAVDSDIFLYMLVAWEHWPKAQGMSCYQPPFLSYQAPVEEIKS